MYETRSEERQRKKTEKEFVRLEKGRNPESLIEYHGEDPYKNGGKSVSIEEEL